MFLCNTPRDPQARELRTLVREMASNLAATAVPLLVSHETRTTSTFAAQSAPGCSSAVCRLNLAARYQWLFVDCLLLVLFRGLRFPVMRGTSVGVGLS